MEQNEMLRLLKGVHDGTVSIASAQTRLKDLPFHDMGYAKVDHHRAVRTGYPEVIFGQNKSVDQIVGIIRQQLAHDETVFGTRAGDEALKEIARVFPAMQINRQARCFWQKSKTWKKKKGVKGTIVIATAGTADVPVGEEARCTVEILGHPCTALYDVGVAGIHRLLAHRELLQSASVLIVIAGMEGALPSVVAGMASCPVIGVPTSVGYGSHMGGLVPLFAMLNSCASGLTVVNVDNGFGAGFAAVMMNGR